MIKASNNYTIQKKVQELEDHIPETERDVSPKSFSVVLPLVIIVISNLVEIGYFIYSNYLFNDFVITLGSAILVGYTLYSMIQFLPKIKKFISKPFKYLREAGQGFDSILNFVMVSLEIVFCAYIMIKIFIKFILLG